MRARRRSGAILTLILIGSSDSGVVFRETASGTVTSPDHSLQDAYSTL